MSGLFCREVDWVVMNLRSSVYDAMGGVQHVCESFVINRRKRDTIPALSVRLCHSFLSSGITCSGSVQFVARRRGKHEPHDAHPFRKF